MEASLLKGKTILAVDDEPDVLQVLENEIRDACPDCTIEQATTYEQAAEMLRSKHYDVVILDIMGVRGFDLLEIAVNRNYKVAMLTAHASWRTTSTTGSSRDGKGRQASTTGRIGRDRRVHPRSR
ncbi:MAG: response regulator [Syntrophorhabdales bacterium]